MNNRYLPAFASALLILICASWLIFCSVMISQDLYPKDVTLISARNFPAPQVQIDLPGGGTKFLGTKVYHRPLIPMMMIPFSIVFLFSLMGCKGLVREQPQS